MDMLGQTNAEAFGGSYQEISYYSEEETTSYQTEGTVKTADGVEMSFQIKVEMSRSFYFLYGKESGLWCSKVVRSFSHQFKQLHRTGDRSEILF